MKTKKLKLKKEVTDVGKYILIGLVILIAILIFLFTKKLNFGYFSQRKIPASLVIKNPSFVFRDTNPRKSLYLSRRY